MPAYVAFWNQEYPTYQKSLYEFDSYVRIKGERGFEQYWILSEGSENVAVLESSDMEALPVPRMIVNEWAVQPSREKQIIPLLVDRAEQIAGGAGAQVCECWTADFQAFRNAYLQEQGYTIVQEAPVSRLDLLQFDPGEYRRLIQRLEREGVRFVSAAELEAEGVDWIAALHPSMQEMRDDVPRTHAVTETPLPMFRQFMADERFFQR